MKRFHLLSCCCAFGTLTLSIAFAEHQRERGQAAPTQHPVRPKAEASQETDKKANWRQNTGSCVSLRPPYFKKVRFNEEGTTLLLETDSTLETFSINKDEPPKLERISKLRLRGLDAFPPGRNKYGISEFSPDGDKIAIVTTKLFPIPDGYGFDDKKTEFFLGVYSKDGTKTFFEHQIGDPDKGAGLLRWSSDGKSIRYNHEVFDVLEKGKRIESPQADRVELYHPNQNATTRFDPEIETRDKLDFFESESSTQPLFSVKVNMRWMGGSSPYVYYGWKAAMSPDRSQAAVASYGKLCLYNVPAK